MNKLMTTLAAIALSFGAFASITTIPLNPGSNPAPFTAKIVGIKAVSSTASGTVSVKEVSKVASSSTVTETVTNIVPKDATYRVADAYVGQTRVYTGAAGSVAWTNTTAQVTIGTETNTVKVSTLYDGASAKWGPVTNVAASVKYRNIVATAPVTNITVKQSAKWTVTPYTNALYSGTLSSGYLSEAVSNKFLLGGTDLVVDGTAFTGGNAYLILER